MSSRTLPDQIEMFPLPPDLQPGRRLSAPFLYGVFLGAVSTFATLAVVSQEITTPIAPIGCLPHEAEAIVREIEALKRAEAAIRLRLLRSGVIVPRTTEEEFR